MGGSIAGEESLHMHERANFNFKGIDLNTAHKKL